MVCFQVLVHEIGHNLGMMHDFGPQGVWTDTSVVRKADNGQTCTGVGGYMDYRPNPNKWSQCSREDFTKYYNYIKNVQGSWCLPLLTSNPTPNPNPTPAECTRKSWVGDGYCDTQTNNAQCFYDSQDCCSPYKRSDWNRYCGNVSKMLISGSAEKVLN